MTSLPEVLEKAQFSRKKCFPGEYSQIGTKDILYGHIMHKMIHQHLQEMSIYLSMAYLIRSALSFQAKFRLIPGKTNPRSDHARSWAKSSTLRTANLFSSSLCQYFVIQSKEIRENERNRSPAVPGRARGRFPETTKVTSPTFGECYC